MLNNEKIPSIISKVVDCISEIPTNTKAPLPKKRDLKVIKFITIHCSDSLSCTPEDLVQWHEVERGWSRPGYHYLVRKDGTIYKLNYGSHVTNHVANFNTVSLGVCLEGRFDHEHLAKKQFDALIELVAALQFVYYPNTTVKGHREYVGVSKTCPGTMINLDYLRQQISNKRKEFENG